MSSTFCPSLTTDPPRPFDLSDGLHPRHPDPRTLGQDLRHRLVSNELDRHRNLLSRSVFPIAPRLRFLGSFSIPLQTKASSSGTSPPSLLQPQPLSSPPTARHLHFRPSLPLNRSSQKSSPFLAEQSTPPPPSGELDSSPLERDCSHSLSRKRLVWTCGRPSPEGMRR